MNNLINFFKSAITSFRKTIWPAAEESDDMAKTDRFKEMNDYGRIPVVS